MAAAAPSSKGQGNQGTSRGDKRRDEAGRWLGLRLSEIGVRFGPQAVGIAIGKARSRRPID